MGGRSIYHYNWETGRATQHDQSPFNLAIYLLSGVRFEMGISAYSVSAKDTDEQPGGLLGLWWLPPPGGPGGIPEEQRQLARAVFHDITELRNSLPESSELAQAYRYLAQPQTPGTPQLPATGGQSSGAQSSGSQAAALPKPPETPQATAVNL